MAFSSVAMANAEGQFGYTGRGGRSCLNCHGSQQYDGLKATLSPAPETMDCMVKVGEGQYKLDQVLKLAPGAQHTITVTLPAGGQQPQCPAYSCCNNDGAGADALCMQEDFSVDGIPQEPGTCVPFLNECGDVTAGFNAEAYGGGTFSVATGGACDAAGQCGAGYTCVDTSADGQYNADDTCEDVRVKAISLVNRGLCTVDGECPPDFECVDTVDTITGPCSATGTCVDEGSECLDDNADGALNDQDDCHDVYNNQDSCVHKDVVAGGTAPVQLTQRVPATFGGADITWTATYTAPQSAPDGVELWVGANVANGNGKADGNDLNSNYVQRLTVGDAVPSFCAVCPDGSLPDEQGNCAGCTSMAVPETSFPASIAAVFGLLGLAFARRRRR